MTHIIMGIGIPGSGKTTVLKPFSERNRYTYISPDEIRAELLGNAEDQSQQPMIWREAYARVAEALERGESVVFDATWAKVDERRNFIRFARESGAACVYGVFAEVPLEVAKERNRTRHRIVPEKVLEHMDTLLKRSPPSVDDGFDRVWDVASIPDRKAISTWHATENFL